MSVHGPDTPRSRVRLRLGFAGLAILAVAAVEIHLATQNRAPARGGVPQPASAPQPVAELRFQSADGKPLELSDFRGKFVLLNVWATWCGPCREEMPALDRVQQQLGGREFEVVALSIDRGGATAVRRFYKEIGIRNLAIYTDPSMEAMTALRTIGIPTTLLVDREGRELWRKTGAMQWDAPDIIDSLRRSIGAAPA